MNQIEESLDIRDILFILRKHIKLLFIISIVFVIAGYTISKYLMTPQYEADATMIVNSSEDQQSTITVDQIAAAQQLVSTYAIILKSYPMMKKVSKNLDLHITPEKLAGCVTVTGVNGTEVLDITVSYPNAYIAAAIANKITAVAPEFIIRTVKAGSVEVISKAKVNTVPVSPNVNRNTLIALLAGIVLYIIIAFALEMLNNKFVNCDDVPKKLGVPMLGFIPSVSSKKN